jgi:hypothetical protein
VIVISGALVLVALVLLVIGLIGPSLGFVYASIAVSLASFGFLVGGILQRRKEELPLTEDLPPVTEGITAILPAPPAVSMVKAEELPVAAGDAGLTGKVLVVAGRPRYHVEGCRYLIGKDADSVDVSDARSEGFTACGVCKPDLALQAAVVEVAEPVVAEVTAPVRAARKATTSAATTKAPPAKKVAKVAAVAPAPVRAAKAAPVKTPAKKAAPVKRGGVIVIPDRGRYHTADCRYVRGAEGTLELTKASATRQGYEPCGVCNP